MQPEKQIHPIPPLCDAASRILVLGSFPSIKSREAMFFYGHPQNRFWPMIAAVVGEAPPQTISEKAALAHRHHIALWDTIASCTITGSSDSSITDVVPNDLTPILSTAPIRHIYCNGTASWKLYQKYIRPVTGLDAVKLPSTSPANAAWRLADLIAAWRVVLADLKES